MWISFYQSLTLSQHYLASFAFDVPSCRSADSPQLGDIFRTHASGESNLDQGDEVHHFRTLQWPPIMVALSLLLVVAIFGSAVFVLAFCVK